MRHVLKKLGSTYTVDNLKRASGISSLKLEMGSLGQRAVLRIHGRYGWIVRGQGID